jgi:hypothetical protein
MKNKELILESLQSLVLHAAKTDERLASFTALISKRLPGLSKKEQTELIERSACMLADVKKYQAQVVKLETALTALRQKSKNEA